MKEFCVDVKELRFKKEDGKLVVDTGLECFTVTVTPDGLSSTVQKIYEVMGWNKSKVDLARLARDGAHTADELYTLNGCLHTTGECHPVIAGLMRDAYSFTTRYYKSITFPLWDEHRPLQCMERMVQRLCDSCPDVLHYDDVGRLELVNCTMHPGMIMFVMAERSMEALQLLFNWWMELDDNEKFYQLMKSFWRMNIRGEQLVALECSEAYNTNELIAALESSPSDVVEITNAMMTSKARAKGVYANKATIWGAGFVKIEQCCIEPFCTAKQCAAF